MLKTNEDRVVEFLLQCNAGPPRTRARWGVDHEGVPFVLPSIGGITVNIAVGDSAFGWAGDHVEPSVSCTANTKKPFEHPNVSLQLYACAGNLATLISGDAKGATTPWRPWCFVRQKPSSFSHLNFTDTIHSSVCDSRRRSNSRWVTGELP